MSPPARVLVVVSGAARIPLREGGSEPTGTFLSELVEPTDAMLAAGFELEFATPGGRVPTIDGSSCSLLYFGLSRARRNEALHSYARLLELGLGRPMRLEEIARDREGLERFDALFVPGGHAPLVDLLHRDAFAGEELNEDFGALARFFHDTGRTTALICHAPAALAAARVDGRCVYEGYRMTVFKSEVDRMLEELPLARRFHGHLPDHTDEVLRSAGARVEQTALPMGRKVVEDRELITAQDPYSARALGAAVVARLRRAAPAAVGA